MTIPKPEPAVRLGSIACIILAATFLGVGAAALAQQPALQTIRLICLPGVPLPVVAGIMHGTFAKYGVEVQSEKPKDADDLRAILASGKDDLAESSVENAVATVAGGPDIVIVMGGEGLTSELIVQPEIKSVQDLRGKTIITDGTDTAYTLAIKKILVLNGLKPDIDAQIKVTGLSAQRLQDMQAHKEYAATVQKPPTSILSVRAGLVSLGPTQDLMKMHGSQGIGAFARREWAQQHADLLARYIAAFVESERWLMSPANKQEAIDMVAKDAKIPVDIAAQTYESNIKDGWQRDAKFDVAGFQNTLKLRAEIQGDWGGTPPAAEKYYDPSYYQKGVAMLKSPE